MNKAETLLLEGPEADMEVFKTLSPYEQGRRLLDLGRDSGRTVEELSALVGLSGGTVSRLTRLVDCYPDLPIGWQQDLNTRRIAGRRARSAIKFSHWVEVHAYFGKGGVKQEIFDLLEQAHRERWSAARLKDEATRLQGLSEDAMPAPAANPARLPPGTPTRWQEVLRHIVIAKRHLDDASSSIPRSSAELTRLLVDAGDGLTTIEQVVRHFNRDELLQSDEATLNANN